MSQYQSYVAQRRSLEKKGYYVNPKLSKADFEKAITRETAKGAYPKAAVTKVARSGYDYRFEKSYAAYEKARSEWAKKEYGLEEKFSKNEYRELYEAAKSIGENNISRTIASEQRLVSSEELRKYKELLDKKQIKVTRRIVDRVEMIDGKEKKIYKTYEENGKIKYKKETFYIDVPDLNGASGTFTKERLKKEGAGALYEYLTFDVGLSAREAGAVVDEIY